MATLRWGDDAPPDTQAACDRLVEAASRCVERFGLTKTTVEDVAREAKVSRATIYRYFGNRDELMLEVLLRDLERSQEHQLDEFFRDVHTPEQFGAAVVEASEYLLETIRSSPRLRELLSSDGAGLTSTIAGASAALFRSWVDDVGPYLAAAQAAGLVRSDVDPGEAAEWVLRTILSLLTIEGHVHHDAEAERRLLTTFLAPALAPNVAPAYAER